MNARGWAISFHRAGAILYGNNTAIFKGHIRGGPIGEEPGNWTEVGASTICWAMPPPQSAFNLPMLTGKAV